MEEKVIDSVSDVAEQTKSLLHIDELKAYLTWGNLIKVAVAVFSILIFYIIYRIIKNIVKKQTEHKLQKSALFCFFTVIR